VCGVWFGGKHETLGWLTPLLLAPSEDTGTYREGGPITPSGVRLGGGRDRHRLAPSGAAPLLLRGGHSVGEVAGRGRPQRDTDRPMHRAYASRRICQAIQARRDSPWSCSSRIG
jgi:hypothetical protein